MQSLANFFKKRRHNFRFLIFGGGGCSVDSAIDSNNRGPEFESSRWKIYLYHSALMQDQRFLLQTYSYTYIEAILAIGISGFSFSLFY